MREIWRCGLALARNDFGSCVALAGADNFAQKIKNSAICCEPLTWRGFDFELFKGYFRAVFSQNCLFFKADLTLNFSFTDPALQKKYARFNTTLHIKFAVFLQILNAKFALYSAMFKFIFARFASGTFIFALKICFASLIKFALLSLSIKTIKICNKCALKPIFAPLRTKLCLNLRRNFATILHLKLIANFQLLCQISQFIFAINSRFNLRQSKNLVLNSLLNRHSCTILHQINLQPNMSLSRCGLSSLLNLCAILRPNLLLNLLEILRSLHQILPPKSALYQNLILRKSFCCDLHLSLSENSRANSRLIERISCEKVA